MTQEATREGIARIVDPKAWAKFEQIKLRSNWQDWPHYQVRWCGPSLAKADQIIADHIEGVRGERDEALARLRNVPALTPFNDAEDAAWPLALARLQNTEPGPDQGIAVVGTDDLELALRRLSQFADVALRNAVVISQLTAERDAEKARRVEVEGALSGIADDYMTSETHHPGYVLIPTAKFERLRTVSGERSDG